MVLTTDVPRQVVTGSYSQVGEAFTYAMKIAILGLTAATSDEGCQRGSTVTTTADVSG
jgi:hypothetical protein